MVWKCDFFINLFVFYKLMHYICKLEVSKKGKIVSLLMSTMAFLLLYNNVRVHTIIN